MFIKGRGCLTVKEGHTAQQEKGGLEEGGTKRRSTTRAPDGGFSCVGTGKKPGPRPPMKSAETRGGSGDSEPPGTKRAGSGLKTKRPYGRTQLRTEVKRYYYPGVP